MDRAARRLVAAWLSGVLVDDLDASASFLDAESWFCGSAVTAATLSLDCARHAQAVLEGLVQKDGAVAMLPYALDPLPHEYRRDVVNKRSGGQSRAARKASGSFFTPADVADHIVGLALDAVDVRKLQFRILDPAAGTGVFLRSAFGGLVERGVSPDDAIAAIFGVDIDERCVDMAAFVLLVDYVRSGQRLSAPAYDTWWRIRSNFVGADALTAMGGGAPGETLFDTATNVVEWLEKPFDVIVGNPPYARLGTRHDLGKLRARFAVLEGATSSTDIYPAFVELLCTGLLPEGAGSMVVPMSIGYSTTHQIRRLRKAAIQAGGRWVFEFYDRTPDALFGDDVKQRAAIVMRKATTAPLSVTTGPVIRWTSRNRTLLFERLPRVDLGDHDITPGVPKVASAEQAAVLASLRSRTETIDGCLLRSSRVTPPITADDGATVLLGGTAYNWLNVYRTGSSVARGVAKPTASPLLALTAPAESTADALYALLSSRIAYWLWRVESDVFHVTSGWVKRLPLTPAAFSKGGLENLAELGRALWSSIEPHPVESLNGGTTTLSYCPHSAPELLDEIDAQILTGFDLPLSFGLELAAFVRDLTAAGRDSQSQHGLRRALASWRES